LEKRAIAFYISLKFFFFCSEAAHRFLLMGHVLVCRKQTLCFSGCPDTASTVTIPIVLISGQLITHE
jgi:hypothetical protein